MTRTRTEIADELLRVMREELLDLPYGGDDPLADQMIDSLGHELLIEHIEESFGVQLADEDMVAENFESIAALAALVESRQAA
jgi:acyl carrier protein